MFHVSLGSQPIGAKHFEGDGKTPEGLYKINRKKKHSQFHMALGISYPSDIDISFATKHGRNAGSDVMIHGLPDNTEIPASAFAKSDWTKGCIAINNQEIEELFEHVFVGTPIRIVP